MATLGTTRRVSAVFSAAGVDTDPGTITLTITAPDATVTTPTPTHDSAGKYHHDVLLDQRGIWTIEWEGTGAVPAEAQTTITVTGASGEGPCDSWISWGEIGDYCTPPDISPALQDGVLAAATRTLWRRSCKQFGLCTITRARIAPLCQHAYTWRSRGGWWPTGGYGSVLGGSGCGCDGYQFKFIDLGPALVDHVSTVWIDGAVLDPSAYRVDDWRRLIRVDGDAWPPTTLQPDQGGEPTIEVTWTYGLAVPDDGRMACALLACKMANDVAAQCGMDPSGVVQKAAEGITIQINPPDGDTGVALVERWLANFHCGGGGIFDPGARRDTIRVDT